MGDTPCQHCLQARQAASLLSVLPSCALLRDGTSVGVQTTARHCQHLMPCTQAQQVLPHTADKPVHAHQTRPLAEADA